MILFVYTKCSTTEKRLLSLTIKAFFHSNNRTMCKTWIFIISNGFYDGYGLFSKFLGSEHRIMRQISRTKYCAQHFNTISCTIQVKLLTLH